MGRLRQDLSFGVKSLARRPVFTLVAVLTLALGIGANAAMVSFALPMLFPSFPHYEDPGRLIVIQRLIVTSDTDVERVSISYPVFLDFQQRNQVCLELSMFQPAQRNLTGSGGDPESVAGLFVSGGLLTTLGIEPYLGRGFAPEDDRRGADRTAMLSYELWQRRFGGDPEIVDRLITLDGLTYAVIGVLPPGLSTEKLNHTALGSIWLPINLFYDELQLGDRRQGKNYRLVCRLKPGVSVSAAGEDIARINHDIAEDNQDAAGKNRRTRVESIRELQVAGNRPAVLTLLAAVIFLLVIACTNLINLFLSRFVNRRQELAIRSALGADRGGLIALGLAEALILALAGGLVGLLAAGIVVRTLPPLLSGVPDVEQARMSPAVFAYTILLCLVVTLVIGLLPALRTTSPSWRQLWTPALGARSFRAHGGLRQGLVVSEFALALALVTATGLALASFLNLRDEDPGYSPRQILALDVALPLSSYGDATTWAGFFDQALSRIATLPGVEAVSLTTSPPMGSRNSMAPVFPGDHDIPPKGKRTPCFYYAVSPDFFQILGISLLEGRTFLPQDSDSSGKVLVISRSVAELYWPGRSAVGQKIGFEFSLKAVGEKPLWREVIGVVEDVRFLKPLSEPPRHVVFAPYTQRPEWHSGKSPVTTLLVKTEMEPTSLTKSVHSEILKLDSNQPVTGVRPLEAFLEEEFHQPRMVLVLLSLIAALALALALVGIYGVVSYTVAVGTRDIGIRMALGAAPTQVLFELLRRNLVLILAGSVLGWAVTAGAAFLASRLLYGVEPVDPVVFSGATLVLVAVALLATTVPALRAIRIDPSRLLRDE